jgi:AcrR family transcriptional regulator
VSHSKSPPTRRRRLSRLERHEAIVDAAFQVFSRLGYRGATTRELARAAGVTEVTLFRHFPSKEELYAAVLDKYSLLPVLRAQLDQVEKEGDTCEALRVLARRLVGTLRDRQPLIRLMLSEAVTNPDQARMLFRQGPARFLQDMGRILDRLQAGGEIRAVGPRIAARAFLSVYFTMVLMQETLLAKETEPLDLDRAADELTDILWRGLQPEPPESKGAKQA